jgi:Skp family chaperone for outer membrane proteins
MKISRLAGASVLVLTASLFVVAQRRSASPAATPARAPQTAAVTASNAGEVKIGLVDTSIFGDEKEGIFRFRDAIKSVELEFKSQQTELDNLKTRFDATVKQIAELSKASVVSQESIKAKQEEAGDLERQMKDKQEVAQKAFEKRYNEVAGPVSRDIGNALTKFAEQRGITLTLDISKLLPAILTIAPAADLTKEFIADYNGKNPVPARSPSP